MPLELAQLLPAGYVPQDNCFICATGSQRITIRTENNAGDLVLVTGELPQGATAAQIPQTHLSRTIAGG